MRRRLALTIAALLVALLVAGAVAGCALDPDYTGTSFQCLEEPVCPDGFTCIAHTCLPADHYRDTVFEDQPIAYYRLDETTGSRASDLFGAHHGLYEGDPTLGAAGLLGGNDDGAVAFDGVDDQMNSTLSVGDTFTIELLVEVEVLPSYNAAIVTAEDYLVSGFRFGVADDGDVDLWASESGGTGSVETLAMVVLPGEVHHLALVVVQQMATIFLDGESSASGAFAWVSTAEPLIVGSANGAAFLLGTIDEVAVFDRAIAADRVRAHAQAAR